ncbi:Tetrathionate response regulatory protein TtrR [Pirellulimonas nuda]|uniref:Tetrathionate response regulatory protein TtrR n=1 Tax=Pirellulimonas nuda TaxID=2528009 RepID=A0A518D6N7_9BACT|nr:LuxR C-terminal-related transcriptional regulator [Pirellulimonas nuda]QDU87147.1 Tetrathionate response regulatory protein TtrR [Pirellulimonas nuda]
MNPVLTGSVGLLELSSSDAHRVTESAHGRESDWSRFSNIEDWRGQIARLNGHLSSQGGQCVIVASPVAQVLNQSVLSDIRNAYANAAIVVASEDISARDAVNLLRAGADDVLVVPCPAEELESVLDRAIALAERRAGEENSAKELKRRLASLTRAENDVLDSLLEGMPNKQIAQQFSIGLRTVELRRSKIMKKMHAGNLAQLVRFVFEARGDA